MCCSRSAAKNFKEIQLSRCHTRRCKVAPSDQQNLTCTWNRIRKKNQVSYDGSSIAGTQATATKVLGAPISIKLKVVDPGIEDFCAGTMSGFDPKCGLQLGSGRWSLELCDQKFSVAQAAGRGFSAPVLTARAFQVGHPLLTIHRSQHLAHSYSWCGARKGNLIAQRETKNKTISMLRFYFSLSIGWVMPQPCQMARII